MIAYFSKHKTKQDQRPLPQEKKNQSIIPRFLNRLWPKWVQLQSSPTSSLFNLHESPDTFTNVSQRNWIYLTAPGSDHSIQLDPQGLLTPHAQPWSLDIWVGHNNDITSASQLSEVRQSFNSTIPSLETHFEAHKTQVILESFIIPLPHNEHIACQTATLLNTSSCTLNLSCFFAIRPYNPEGITSCKSISYLPQQAFTVNHRLALVLDKKPDNIICLPFAEGDCIEHAHRWEMVLNAECPMGQATAIAEYRFSLAPNEKKEFSCKIPLHTPSTTQKTKLTTTISQIQSLNSESEKKRIGKLWESALPPCQFSLPDKTLENLINNNIFHLISHSDTHTHKLALEQLHILATQLLFNSQLNPESHFRTIHEKLDLHDLYDISVFNVNLLNYLEKNPNQHWAKKQSFAFQKIWKNVIQHLKKNHTAITNNSTQTLYWLITALKKTASLYSDHPPLSDLGSELESAAKTILTHINSMCNTLEQTRTFHPILPISPTEWTDARLVEALCGVFPLNLIDAYDTRVTETLKWLETHCLLHNNILYNQMDPTGLCTHQNARLAQLYVSRKDNKAWDILNWLIETASPAGTWPGAFHPIHLTGCDGEGHSRETMVEFLHLIRSMFISETNTTLHLLPFIPDSWIEKGLTLRITHLPTQFGNISIETKQVGSEVSITITPTFHQEPEEILISLPSLTPVTFPKGKTTHTLTLTK